MVVLENRQYSRIEKQGLKKGVNKRHTTCTEHFFGKNLRRDFKNIELNKEHAPFKKKDVKISVIFKYLLFNFA